MSPQAAGGAESACAMTLAWYTTERFIPIGDKRVWLAIRRWEQAGLVSVRPINSMSARVVLTYAGRERAETGEAAPRRLASEQAQSSERPAPCLTRESSFHRR